jgi:predicted nucleotidyltransferase
MGGGGGSGSLFRTYKGGTYSQGGFSKKTFYSKESQKPNDSAEEILNRHIQSIRVSSNERLNLNDLKNEISDSLSQEMRINRINVIGSTAKNTQIKNQKGNDIDILIELDEKEHGEWLKQENGARNCLEKVKRVMQNDPRFKNVEMHVDRNVVTVEIGNKKADVIPSFPSNDGGHLIPYTSGQQSWIKTNPKLSSRLFKNLDKKYDNKLSELTMEVKSWNQRNGGLLKSHHIECMTYDYFTNNKSENGENSRKVNTREFFERMRWYLKRHVKDPIYRERADTYLSDENRLKVIANSKKSTKILRQAEKEARNGNEEECTRLYKEFIGE